MMTWLQTLRGLRREPVFAFTVALMTAMSVAAVTTFFALFNALFLQPLPFPAADRTVHIEAPPRLFVNLPRDEVAETERTLWNSPLLELRTRVRTGQIFDEASDAVRVWNVRPSFVSANFFALFGMPAIGTPCGTSEQEVTPRPVLISTRLWQTRFGGSPTAIGQPFTLKGSPDGDLWILAGVMPPTFSYPEDTNFWICRPLRGDGYPSVPAYARLAYGASIEQLSAAAPRVRFTPLPEHVRPHSKWLFALLLACSVLFVLATWVQIAGIIFSRAVQRTREIGIRLALGATGSRLILLFAQELAVLLSSALALAWIVTPHIFAAVRIAMPGAFNALTAVLPSATFAFALLMSLIAFAIFLLVPIPFILSTSPSALVRGGALVCAVRAVTARRWLLIVQLALTAVIAYLLSLSIQSFVRLAQVDLGFEPADLAVVSVPTIVRDPSRAPREQLATHRQRVRSTLDDLRQVPGILGATSASEYPFQPGGFRIVPLTPESSPNHSVEGRMAYAAPGYLRVLGLELLEGREPLTNPPEGWPGVGLASRSLADVLAVNGPPIGQIVSLTDTMKYRIHGIFSDVRSVSAEEAPEPTLLAYVPGEAVGSVLLLRFAGPAAKPRTLADNVLRAHWGQDTAPKLHEATAIVARSRAPQLTRLLVIGSFAVVAIALACAGIFGCFAHVAALHRREIAMRVALGAAPNRILLTFVGEALWAGLFSILIGLSLGAVIAGVLRGQFFGTNTLDSSAMLLVGGVLLALTVLGASLPAHIVARMDPWSVLKVE